MVGAAAGVGGIGDVHCAQLCGQWLMVEAFAVEAHGAIERVERRAGKRREEHGRALRRDEAVAVDLELVAAGLAAKDGVVLEDEAGLAGRVLHESLRRGKSADASADDDAIVSLLGRGGLCGERVGGAVAHGVSGEHDGVGVAVSATIVAYAAEAVPLVLG